MNILFVENDPNLCLLWSQAFRERGLSATGATTMAEAIAALERGDCGIMVLDLYIGDETARKIVAAAERLSPMTAIVLVTGAAQDIPAAVGADRVEILHKPVDIEDLLAIATQAHGAHLPGSGQREGVRRQG